ncbi:FUSC family protein [Rhizobium sp. C4]|uniref:FUSC family protein n=1 Tax=Rhizobium sp. C4 TaxID=1349800 RepID=UPI001E4FB475|nr:FUSC family protein [Rhizobium sp. C4]MCD2173958.1 FUSC family protein [Rhizobium sp. C4]
MSEFQSSGDDAEASSLAVRRLDAAGHLVKPHQFRESLAVNIRAWDRNSVLVGVQASLASAITLVSWLVSPWPQLAGVAALGALAVLFGRFAPEGQRGRVVLTCAFWLIVGVVGMSVASRLGAAMPVRLGLLAFACGFFFFVVNTARLGPPGALIFVFAAGAAMGDVASWQEVGERGLAMVVSGALAWLICVAGERLRHAAPPGAPTPIEPVRPLPHRLIAAGRISLGAAIAVFAAHAFGSSHPGWAALGSLAVMQGTHLHISMNRALQRMAGTVLGAGLVWIILTQGPSVWTVIALVVCLQFVIEMVIGANYALGQIFITPLALLMAHLASNGADGATMVAERVFDTVAGACIGIVVAVICSTVDDRAQLARHHAARSGQAAD